MQLKNSGGVVQALNALVHASALNAKDGAKLTALIQNSRQADDDSDAGAPEAATYEGHSSGIIETLENLLEEAEGQLSEARKKETSSKNNYEMLKQSLEDDIANANKDMDAAKKSLAASGETKAAATGDLTTTSKALSADIATLEDLHKDCLTKAQDFEAATKSRSEELKALAEAKKNLEGDNSWCRSANIWSEPGIILADDIESRTGTVRGSEADATEKAYCDKELAETRTKKEDKTAEIEKLST